MEEEEQYVATLNHRERTVLEIAKDHLGSSFDLTKSLGYIEWKKKKKDKHEGVPRG
tara:strand:+ start:1064 stop:1231 length:168 start_codon:yes stop_codon:yes gene_type:complete